MKELSDAELDLVTGGYGGSGGPGGGGIVVFNSAWHKKHNGSSEHVSSGTLFGSNTMGNVQEEIRLKPVKLE